MRIFKLALLGLIFFVSPSHAVDTLYNCQLKIHCSQLHEDQAVTFEYAAGTEKKEAKTVDLGVVRARVYGPHYFSLYLFDTRSPNTIWTKSHTHSLIDDLEVSLIIPENEEHSMVANLSCWKKQ